jgi:DNA-binding CsgD family transcriptional regulator/PAS domain-containing protein
MSQADPIERLLGTLYAAPLQPELWDVFLRDLSVACGVTKAALIAHDLLGNEHRMLATVGDAVTEATPLYETHYCQFDEWTAGFSKRKRVDRFVLGEEIWPDASLTKSLYYNEFLKPFDVCQMACFATSDQSGFFEALSIYRGPSEDSFSIELLGMLRIMAPHLESALGIRRRLVGLESRVSDLESALDHLTCALILLDVRGRCILVNKAAKRILDQRDGLTLERSMLSCWSHSESASLRKALAFALTTGQGRDQRCPRGVAISRHARAPLQIIAAPFKSEAAVGKNAAAIVFLNDSEQQTTLPSEVLRMLYGLTVSEARLALTLLDGRSLSEAAELHKVRQETVRTQVKSVFQKTGAKRQGELIKLLAKLSSVSL